ncbi:MAG: insulinase family protein [Deltaproteobacteria bacterium]|nr:insulinase family protein [Deltaproteobacteria bacterium]
MNARWMAAALAFSMACATTEQKKPELNPLEQEQLEEKQKAEAFAAEAKKKAEAQAKEREEAAAAAAKAAAEKAAMLKAMIAGEDVLLTRPTIAPLSGFEAPVPAEVKLKNGLRVLVIERAGAPIESLVFVTKLGSTRDPAGKGGLSSITAAMLEAGSAKKSQTQIAQLADSMGATLRALATTDGLEALVSAQPGKLNEMGALLADVAMKPNFDPGEWKKAKAQRLAQLTDEMAEPRVAAVNAAMAALYGDAPLGHTPQGTPKTVGAIELADVKSFWAQVDPSEAVIIAVGSATQAQVLKAVARFEGIAKGKGAATAAPAGAGKDAGDKAGQGASQAPADGRPRFVFVDFPGRPQSVLWVGQPSVPSSSPDQVALRAMNVVLGGSFTSRLNQNLREKNGYSYGAFSNFAFGKGPGAFQAASSVKTQVTGAALGEMLKEIAHAVNDPLSNDELDKGKAMLAYGLVEQLERADQTALAFAGLFTAEVPMDTLRKIVPQLKTLTVAEVNAAAKRSLAPDAMTIVIAGDPGVMGQLDALKLPAPQKRDATGAKQ